MHDEYMNMFNKFLDGYCALLSSITWLLKNADLHM